jgi:hypothetical protein
MRRHKTDTSIGVIEAYSYSPFVPGHTGQSSLLDGPLNILDAAKC